MTASWSPATPTISIPWDGAYRTTQVLGGESRFVLSTGGHIQVILNPPGNPKAADPTSDSLPPSAVEWRDGVSQIQGSWWTLWHEWLTAWLWAEAAKVVAALGTATRPVLYAAPGVTCT